MIRVLKELELLGEVSTMQAAYALVDLHRTLFGGDRSGYWVRT
jgi:hypothetical protein